MVAGVRGWKAAGSLRWVAAAGLSLAALTAAADLLGLFRALERQSIDWRFAHAPRPGEPLSAEIRFVDVDDSALEFGRRWPWPRARLAVALAEIVRARPRTLALDLLLDEQNESEAADAGDRRIAEALGATRAVVAVDCGDDDERALAAAGDPAARTALLEALADHWSDAPARVAASIHAAQELVRDVSVRPQTWRRMAAARRLARLSGDGTPLTLEAFEKTMQRDAPVAAGRHDAELLGSVHRQDSSWRTLRRLLLPDDDGATVATAAVVEPAFAKAPLPEIAARCAGAGFVNFAPDPDGRVRELAPVRAVPGGRALQLGVAAALVQRGIAPAAARIDGETLRVGDESLPLHAGRLALAWPTPGGEARGEAPTWFDPGARCSLGRALDVGEARAALERVVAERAALAGRIAETSQIRAEGEALLAKVREEATFRCRDAAEAAQQGGLTAEESEAVAPFRQFLLEDGVATRGAEELAAAQAQLERLLADRLVFVGWTATGAASDFVPTPMGARTPGVSVHAVAANMVLSGRSYRFLAPIGSPLLTIAVGMLATVATLLVPLASAAAGLVLLLGYAALAVVPAFAGSHLIVPMVAPLIGGAAAWAGGTALRAAFALRSQQRITRQFKARVAPELVDYLVDHQDALSMAGEPREVTAFFLDLAGFTSLSEELGARGSVALLNRCMRRATVELTRHQAYVNKYLGDGLMAFWSAFRPDPEQATRACRAALGVMEQLAQVAEGGPLSARVGIATGRVIVGDCGAPPLLHDYTAIGDSINLAARLESANKQFGTKILVDGRTREQVHTGDLRFRPCGRVVVVGQSVAADLFEIAPPKMSDREIELTADAVDAWRRGRLVESGALFRRLEAEFGASRIASLYLDAIAKDGAAAPAGAERVLRLQAK
jgi:class 3 adenylate cyclase